MKNLDEFVAEETGEEWLRELYKVIALRRNAMFRMITESVRLLLLGNVGGVGLLIGLMTASADEETAAYHWASLITLLVFAVGTLASALTMILVTAVSVQEAHGAEKGLRRFLGGEIDRSEVLFSFEGRVFRTADFATLLGAVSGATFLLGGISAIVLMILFF